MKSITSMPHICPPKGRPCAICHWISRREAQEIIPCEPQNDAVVVVGGGKMEEQSEPKACGNADDS
jgi:hypothetical protein